MFNQIDSRGYHFRKQYRRAMEDWLAQRDFLLAVTLSFKQNVDLGKR